MRQTDEGARDVPRTRYESTATGAGEMKREPELVDKETFLKALEQPAKRSQRRASESETTRPTQTRGSKKQALKTAPGASEEDEQITLFRWVDANRARHPALAWLYHTPNGGNRDKRQNPKTGQWYSPSAVKLKRMGARAGIPDLILPLRMPAPGGRLWLGWVGELKVGDNTTTAEQEAWLMHYQQQGWSIGVYYSWTAAAVSLCRYLGIDEREAGL
jgi:hypothetical protein